MFTGNFGRLAARFKLPTWKCYCCSVAPIAFLILFAAPSAAAEPALTLGEAVRLAVEQEPGQTALTASADALAERATAAGELPLPQWRAGLANYPVSGGGLDREPMTMVQVGVQQMFPGGDSRKLRQRMLLENSDAAASRAAGRAEFVREAVRVAWLDAYFFTEAIAVVSETRPWLEDLSAVARGHYEAGHKGQKDLVRAELEIAKIDQRQLEFRRELEQSRARLSQWVGVSADRPIARVLPATDSVPELEQLLANLREHPQLRASDAQVAASETAIGLARESFKPDWSIGLSYGYRSGTAADGRDRSDLVSVQVTRDLPILGRKKQNSELAAALKERQASEASRDQELRRLSAALAEAYARYTELGAQIAQQQSQVMRLAQFEADAALTAYQNNRGDFSELAMARVQVLQSKLDLIRLQVAQAKAWATIANLGGSQS